MSVKAIEHRIALVNVCVNSSLFPNIFEYLGERIE